jgi:hypothetical protein
MKLNVNKSVIPKGAKMTYRELMQHAANNWWMVESGLRIEYPDKNVAKSTAQYDAKMFNWIKHSIKNISIEEINGKN